MVETPHKGRAIIIQNFNNLVIEIPSKKNIFQLIFISFWLCGWVFGEYFAINQVVNSETPIFGNLFLLFWLCGWTIGGVFAMLSLLWMLFGNEVVSVEYNKLTIGRLIGKLGIKKSYEIREIKNFDVDSTPLNLDIFGNERRGDISQVFKNNKGKLKFDYGMKTIRFINEVDESEAKFIFEKLKISSKFTKENFKQVIPE